MSAVAEAPRMAPGMRGGAPEAPEKHGMSKGRKIGYSVVGAWLGGIVLFIILFGFKGHKVPAVASGVFSPTDEFKLDTWFKLGPIAFNKGILYLLLTVGITIGVMAYVAKRLQQRPGRLQVAVEMFYDFTRRMSRENLDAEMERKYFPLIATIFVFILVTNLIGYIPLPVDSGETFKVFGAHIPSLQIYAADTNVAFPLILALGVFIIFNYEGVKHHGPIGYVKSLMPGGVTGPIVGLIFPHRDPVELPAPGLADRATVGEPARRPPADRVHGRRAGRARRGPVGLMASAAVRGRDLLVRGGADRRPASFHLFHPDRHLSR